MSAPTFNTYYTHYSDEVARLADSIVIENDGSPSLAGGDDYAPETLVDDNPAKLAKITEGGSGSPAAGLVSGAWVLSYSAPQPIALVGLIHHSFGDPTSGSPSGSVRFEGNVTDDFSSPAMSVEIEIPEWLGTGTGRWPQNAWKDLTGESGYLAGGYQFYRLIIEDNPQNIELGQLWCASVIRQFDPDLRWGLSIGADKPQIENRTSFGVSTIYARGTTIWTAEADIQLTDEMRDALEAHWYDVEGRARPWLLVPSGPGTPNRCYLVRYTMTDRQAQWNSHETHSQHLSFQEVGRGLRPGE